MVRSPGGTRRVSADHLGYVSSEEMIAPWSLPVKSNLFVLFMHKRSLHTFSSNFH